MKISERVMGARIVVEAKDRQTTRISYFPGRDRSTWRTHIPSYGRVTLGHITPNIRIDLKAHGEDDVFLARLDADLTQLRFATYIGGDTTDVPTDLILNAAGELYLLGWTISADFPVPAGGYGTSYGLHEEDGFILKLNAAGDKIQAGPFLGGAYDGSA
jgi:hypothetical protein